MELIKGLRQVLREGSLLAYVISLTLRITEIQRVLKKEGSFFLHCDPTASHYIKLVLDGIFCAQGGDFKNEVVWKRTTAHSDTKQGLKRYGKIHDVIFFYSKSRKPKFRTQYTPYEQSYIESHYRKIEPVTNRRFRTHNLSGTSRAVIRRFYGASSASPVTAHAGMQTSPANICHRSQGSNTRACRPTTAATGHTPGRI